MDIFLFVISGLFVQYVVFLIYGAGNRNLNFPEGASPTDQ